MQTMLPQRLQDHLDWMGALDHSIRTGTPFTKARNPHECAFGKWFYGYHARDRRLSLLLWQFEQPHAAIHALADKLLGLAESGRTDEAIQGYEKARTTTLATLMGLFDSAEKLLVDLQRRIAIVMADGSITCALGADCALDIVTIPHERIKEAGWRSLAATSQAAAALIVLDDQSVAPLLDWQAMCTRKTN